jgi:hypothetical protein
MLNLLCMNALREALKKEDAYSEELFDNYYKMRKERGDSLRQIMKNYETIGKLRGSLGLFTVLDTGKNIQDSSLWQQHVQEKIYHYGQFNCDHFSLFSHNNTQEIISVYREFLNGLKHK